MEKQQLTELLLQMLRAELNEEENPAVSLPEGEDLIALFRLAKRHDLAHIASSFLYRQGIAMSEETKRKFQKQEMISVYRYEQMKLAFDGICKALEEKAIDYIPLKGLVIRPYYPKESMRTSCDIDILIREEALESAVSALEAEGYECRERNYHDVSLFSPFGIHLELHFNIQENHEKLDPVLSRAWEYARVEEGHRYMFDEPFFTFHMFAHMAYHFLSGGCGIRSLMDIWVMKHRMGLPDAVAESLLREAEIWQFAEAVTELSEICFSGAPKDDMSDLLLTYLINGGVYGSSENHAAMAPEAKTSVEYMARRVFVPYRVIAMEYPAARKYAILYPFCWMGRTGKLFARFFKRRIRKKQVVDRVTETHLDEAGMIRNRLGL